MFSVISSTTESMPSKPAEEENYKPSMLSTIPYREIIMAGIRNM